MIAFESPNRLRAFPSYLAGLGLLVFGASPALAQVPPSVADVAKDPSEVPASPTGDVTVDLDVVEVVANLGPGPAWVWAFATKDGKPTVPGPMIRVREGNHVTVNLCNKVGNIEPHNLDFHASMGPGGGAAVTGVEPGECKTFTFKAMRQGAYIYHCAAEGMPWEHVSYGMYGLIQVDPPGGLQPGYKEFYVGQSDWYLMPNAFQRPFPATPAMPPAGCSRRFGARTSTWPSSPTTACWASCFGAGFSARSAVTRNTPRCGG